ncbi:hypothetical protein K502DRAFT_323879 [Neoconidiobolus thromboides FSU 785]|nr:hypothetical protein K502DRAFT_323879 [Neoconidiobolus thromboides FSU 785]
MSRYFSLFSLCLIVLFSLITAVKYDCNVATKDNNLTCECTAQGASNASVKLECKENKNYCSSEVKSVDNDKVFIAFCTEELIGLVEKKGDKYEYSEINNLSASADQNGAKYQGSIDSEKKDNINIYKRLFRKIRKLL